MKKKIIGILVCLMLMTAFLTAAQNVKNVPVRNSPEEIDTISFDGCEVPIWEEGDKWTYKVDKIVIDFEEADLSVYLEGNVSELPLEVTEVTEDFYELTFKASISGSYEVNTDLGHGPINTTGELKSTTVGGTITFNKTDLGIKQVNVEISGKLTVKVEEQPYFNLSFLPNIPIPATIILNIDLSDPYPIIEFPLNTSKCWGLPATNFSLGGTIESICLRIANIINGLVRALDIISKLERIFKIDLSSLQEISDILWEILPKIKIEDVLNDYLGGNVFEIPAVPPVICCYGKDNITLPEVGETFNAYNISLPSDLANIYYAPEVGNVIKVTGNFEDVLPFVSNINAELISYEYIP